MAVKPPLPTLLKEMHFLQETIKFCRVYQEREYTSVGYAMVLLLVFGLPLAAHRETLPDPRKLQVLKENNYLLVAMTQVYGLE